MVWWAWLLVDLVVVLVAAAITARVAWRGWKALRHTLGALTSLDVPTVERPVRE